MLLFLATTTILSSFMRTLLFLSRVVITTYMCIHVYVFYIYHYCLKLKLQIQVLWEVYFDLNSNDSLIYLLSFLCHLQEIFPNINCIKYILKYIRKWCTFAEYLFINLKLSHASELVPTSLK